MNQLYTYTDNESDFTSKHCLIIYVQLQHSREEIDEGNSSGDDNYEKVDDSMWLRQKDDIYKVPRNVVRTILTVFTIIL